MLQAQLPLLEVFRHFVKGADQYPDLIPRPCLYPHIEVPVGHGLCSLSKLLNRDGDPPGEIIAEPYSREDDQECNDRKGEKVAAFDRFFKGYHLLVLFKQPCNLLHLGDKTAFYDGGHGDDTDDLSCRSIRSVDRGYSYDDVSGL